MHDTAFQRRKSLSSTIRLGYGVGLCATIGVAAKLLSNAIPIGSVTIAILLGIVVGNGVNLDGRYNQGITFSEKQLLSVAIALMGVNLNYVILGELGLRSLGLIISGMGITILASLLLSRITKSAAPLALLVGIGSGVCGSSAIAATEGIIGADEEEVGLSVAIVNFLGTLGIFLLPFLSIALLGFNQIEAGVLVGNTLQAVGQVTAAGFAVGEVAGQTATVIKMGRILMLTPLILVLLSIYAQKGSAVPDAKRGIKAIRIPIFIIGFILFSLIATFGLLPEWLLAFLATLSGYALIVAMAGIGLKITFSSMLRSGRSALLLGGAVFLIQIVFSGSAIYLLY
jgi:uncharacterized integral membrane protein (TIGR00698 family)